MEYTLTIVEKRVETPDTVTILFKQPALRKIKYRAGQYITVIAQINGRKYRRPYSLSSVYGIDATLNITVKAIPGGVVSNYIVHQWKPGDSIAVMAPMGDYILPDPYTPTRLYCWCAGSGITPNYALIREALTTRPGIAQIVLVYSNKNAAHTIFHSALEALVKQHGARLTVYRIYTEDNAAGDALYKQRIDSDCINRIWDTESAAAAHFICGPAGMATFVANELHRRGVADEQVFFENFQLQLDTSLLEEVVAAEAAVCIREQLVHIRIPKGASVLEALLDEGIDFPYSCQAGTCGLCRAIVKEGRVVAPGIRHNTLEAHECLLCSSFPATSQLTLQIP